MAIYYKIHDSKHGKLLAACDSDLIGKTLKGSEGQEFFVNPRFYKGRKGTKKDLFDVFKWVADANLVGKEAVGAGIEIGLVDKKYVHKIEGVPHALVTVVSL